MKLLLKYPALLLLTIITVFNGCKTAEKEIPVTAQEAKDFAKALQASIEKRSGLFFDGAFDKKKFLRKAGLTSESDARSFGSGVSEKLNIGTQLVSSISKKSTYELVKQYEKDGKQHVLFRLYDDGSLNYHDIELSKSGKEVKIADMFIYTSGESFSETINTLFKQMKTMAKKGELDTEDGWLLQLPKLRKLMNENKYDEAIEIYDRLPLKVKNLRAVQLTHVLITSGLDDNEKYAAAIDEYRRLYPNEPNMHLILIDGYILKKEYAKALASVNELDKMINKDPFLDYHRYLINTLMKDNVTAKKHIEAVVKNYPGFEDGMLELIATYKEENETEKLKPMVETYKSRSAFDQERLKLLLGED